MLTKTVILADPAQRVPWPGVPGRLVPAGEAITVPAIDPYWAALIRDGTLVDPPPRPAGKPKA